MNNILTKLIFAPWGKTIDKTDLDDYEGYLKELDGHKYEKLIKVFTEAINKKKYTLKLKNIVEKLKEENITEEEENFIIEEAIKEIEDEKLEYELDLQCERYNKYTTNNPAEYIFYNNNKKYYTVSLPKEKEKSSKYIEKLIDYLKENNSQELGKKLSKKLGLKKIQYKNKKIIIYLTEDNKAYFDINHIVNLFDELSAKDKKYQEYKNEIELYKIVDNDVGGFYIKEFISKEIFFKMILHTNSIFSNEFKNEVSKILDKLTDNNIIVIEDDNLIVNENIIPKNINSTKKSINNIMGNNAVDLYEYMKSDKVNISCIYFFTLGTVKKLRLSMNIDNKYNDEDIVGKFGYTKDLSRRMNEHIKELGEIENCELKLKCYSYIDPEYMSKAEIEIKKLIEILNCIISYKNKEEIFIIKNNMITYIEDQYSLIGIKYKTYVSEYTNKLKELEDNKDKEKEKLNNYIKIQKLEHENTILKKDSENAITILKKDLENTILKKDSENAITILKKDLEYKLLQKELENTILKKDLEIQKEKCENMKLSVPNTLKTPNIKKVDIYLSFLNECTEENKGHIHCVTLYNEFKYWFKNNNPNTKIPNNKEFANGLKKHKRLEQVRVLDKILMGIKNLKIIEDNNDIN
jgi:hypothetical protein